MAHDIVILGVFVADTAYRAARQPKMGETILGKSFSRSGRAARLEPGCRRCARAGGDTAFLTKLATTLFADMAMSTWEKAGVNPSSPAMPSSYTGAAYIFLEEGNWQQRHHRGSGRCGDHFACRYGRSGRSDRQGEDLRDPARTASRRCDRALEIAKRVGRRRSSILRRRSLSTPPSSRFATMSRRMRAQRKS